MPWWDFLGRDTYQKWFERDRFEEETEPKETWLTKAYGKFREGAEAVRRAPAPPSTEQLGTGMTAAAERLRETAGGLGIERLAGTATELELRRARGQAPAQARAGFPYEEETVAARGRLTESLREGHPEWSEEQLHFAATSAIDPGEGFMPMAAWGLAMRPALAAMAATSVKAAGPAARLTATQAKQLIPRAKDVLMEEAGGLKPKPKPLWEPEAMQVAKPKPAAQAFREATEIQGVEGLELGLAEKFERAAGRANRVFRKEELTGEDLQRAIRAIVQEEFGHDPIITLYRGLHPGGKAGEAAGRWWSWKPFTAQRFAQRTPGTRGPVLSGELRASELANPELAGFIKSDSFELGPFLENKIRVKGVQPGKPTAAAARPTGLEEAPAWELGGMGTIDDIEAITLRGVGRRPPPPRKPPTAEAVPPTVPPGDPVPKLIKLIKAAKPVRAETEALKTAARRKQAAAMGRIFEKHPGEAPYRAKGVLKGELPSAAYDPPGKALSEAEKVLLRRQVRTFFEKEGGRAFDELSVREALEGMLAGKQPTWGEIGQLQSVFGRQLGAALEGKMPLMKRVGREALEIWNLGRTFKASLDQSWHLRQGIRLGARHPKESVREGVRGMKALWSQQTYEDSVRFIREGQEAGQISRNLFTGRVGPGATTIERTEAYISKWSDVIPGIKHTAREYAASGNLVRGMINKNMNKTWAQRLGRRLTAEEMDWTGRVCNWGLGRGPLPDEFRGLLAGIFFAPGYRTAGPAYFSLLLNPKTPAFVRRMVAEEVVTWVGAGVGLAAILELSGVADVEGWDFSEPGRVSSDFGKIRVGNMRFDIWGGSQQQVRAILGLITGERKTLSTDEIMELSRKEVASRYVESGFQPSMGLATSLWTGKDWEGKPLTPGGAIQDLFAPMAAEDIIEAVREEGAMGWIAAPFAHLGVGVWTPDLAGVKVQELTQRYDEEGRGRNEMSAVEFDRLADEHPDLAEARAAQIKEAADRGSDWAEFTLKREEADAEFEKGLKEALLDPEGRTYQEMAQELGDHVYEWAIRSDEFYGELDLDPRDDLERRINAYYALELPAFATEEQRSAFFRQREQMLEDDAELEAAIHDHQVFRFTDPDVRRFVDLKWQAGLVANEYYSIPAKIGMSAERQEKAARNVEVAQSIATQQGKPFLVALIEMGLPAKEQDDAFIYSKLPDNPKRKMFRHEYPEKWELFKAFYSDIPLGIPVEAEPEMAGVGR